MEDNHTIWTEKTRTINFPCMESHFKTLMINVMTLIMCMGVINQKTKEIG
jgi:hypothetical protein